MVRCQVIILSVAALVWCRLLFAAGEEPTEFSLVAPQAKAVFVAGEFNHWNKTATPLKRDTNGRWNATIPLLPGKHAYKFVVDGEWKVDAANPEQTKDGFGGLNSVVTVTDPGVDPVVDAKDQVRRQAMNLFAKSDFAKLEQIAAEFRRDKSRFSDGLWKLKEFYQGLKARNDIGEEKDWQPWFEKLDRWREQFSESITVPVVTAQGWLDYGSEIRDTKGRKEAIGNARTVLNAAANLPARCAHWYAVMQDIADRQNWPSEDFAKLLAEAAAAEPTYYDYYANAADYFLARNHDKDELDRVADEAATKFDPTEGMAAYARTVWFMENRYQNIFEHSGVTWQKLRQGFLDIQKRYPDSRWNANAFCRFAVQAKDRQTAGELIKKIGERGDPNWGGSARYEMAKIWADPATPSWRVDPVLAINIPGKPAVHSIAFSPDGRSIASGTADGRIALWDVTTGKQLWTERVASFPVMSVVFSPDGKLLAAGAGQEYRGTEPGLAKVWNLESKKEIVAAKPKGVVWKIAFTPDGKTLALSGGQWERQAESSLLNIETGDLRELPWTTNHDHILKGVAISPDGKTLVTDCYQSITVWGLAENRILFDTKNVVRDFVLCLAYAPDGKTVVTCGAPMRGRNDTEPGELTIWDTSNWKPRTPRGQTDAGGLVGVACSPDGKLIAGGGYDEAVHVWDATTLESKAIYIAHDGMIWSVAFSPDSKAVASASDDGAIKLWTLP